MRFYSQVQNLRALTTPKNSPHVSPQSTTIFLSSATSYKDYDQTFSRVVNQ